MMTNCYLYCALIICKYTNLLDTSFYAERNILLSEREKTEWKGSVADVTNWLSLLSCYSATVFMAKTIGRKFVFAESAKACFKLFLWRLTWELKQPYYCFGSIAPRVNSLKNCAIGIDTWKYYTKRGAWRFFPLIYFPSMFSSSFFPVYPIISSPQLESQDEE